MPVEREPDLRRAGDEQCAASTPAQERAAPPAPAAAPPARVLSLQQSAGNAAVAQVMRNGTAAAAPPGAAGGTAVPRTSRSTVDEAAAQIYVNLSLAQTEARREATLRELLVHHDRAGELIAAYRARHERELLGHIGSVMGAEDALRADEYLTWGRLRPVAKLLLALDGAGTAEETVWRVLPEAHADGDPAGRWAQLVARPLAICSGWAGMSLDAALDSDLDGADLDKARALARHGRLRPIDKIRIGTNGAGTDEAMVLEGLREADRATVRADYRDAYGDDLEALLFDRHDEAGNVLSEGELSGEDARHARLLLDVGGGDPQRLVRLVQVASSGAGTNEDLIWDSVGEAVRRSQAPGPDADAARAQLSALRAQVEHPDDPLGLRGTLGELSDADHARLRALLGIAESDPTLDDPLVQRLRGLGGLDNGSTFATVLKLDAATTRAMAAAFRDRSSALHRYLWDNVTVTSGEWSELSTVFGGSLYARLRLCAGGLRDDYEDYAYALLREHASPDERRALRTALRAVDRGATPEGEAGRAILALQGAFSTGEMGQVRQILQSDSIGVLDRAQELEESIERERSWWLGLDDAVGDERRELRAGITQAGLDARLSPGEEARLRSVQGQVQGALEDYVRVRDAYTDYASQAISFAAGLLIAAATGGAAGPAVIAAIMRAAAASALARVAAEKALRGDRFDLAGADGVRAFVNGAVDGAMNIVGAGIAARGIGAVGGQAMREALEQGTASLGVRLVGSAMEGAAGGGAGGAVDAVTNEDTWRGGVANGLARVIDASLAGGGQGAGMSVGVTGVTAGAGALRGRGGGGADPHPTAEPHGAGPAAGPQPATDPHAPGAATGPHATPDPATGGGDSTAAGVARRPGDLFDAHPSVALAREGVPGACSELLDRLGPWEVAMRHLDNGTGPAASLSPAARPALRDALVAHRERLLADLDQQFGARRVGQASREPGSDVDVNVMGETAGQRLIEARAWLDAAHPGWRAKYRMALLVDASRVGTAAQVLEALSPAHRAPVEARITRTGELYATARRARALEGPERAALLGRLPAEDRARIEPFLGMDGAARRAALDRALQDGDAAMQRLRGETDPAERARLAAEVTERQMLANMLEDDAYITPGAVGQFAAGRPARTPAERYQAALDQVAMVGHQVHEHGGVLGAMRRYEIFKYIERFCDVATASGVVEGEDLAKLTFLRNWAEYVYRVERGATADAQAVPGPRRLAGSADTADVRLTEIGQAQARAGVSDRFLLDNYAEFAALADRLSGRLRREGLGEEGGAVLTVPRLTPEDAAARARPAAAAEPEAVTAAGAPGPAQPGATPALGPLHAPIGRAPASPDEARALVVRLTAGDASALEQIGVRPPPGYDPRGREWGIGRTRTGEIVILQGDTHEVAWAPFIARGGTPLAHSHPFLPGRALDPARPRRIGELIGVLSHGDRDALHVLPSTDDFIFCGRKRLAMHEVHVPYALDAQGRLVNPAPGLPPATFRIMGIETVGHVGERPVYRALLAVGDARGVVDVEPVWVVDFPEVNLMYAAAPPDMTPVPPGQPGGIRAPTGAGAGAGQEEGP